MISYDNYKNRIEKLAKAKRTAHKFRFLIMGAVALVLGTSVGLMVAKGAHTSETLISAPTIEFSQSYEVTPAKAFLDSASSQKIEYSLQGSDEWTTDKPVKAGKYFARTVSPKLIGYSYSSPVAFEILPRAAQFDIVGDSVVYGDVPDCRVTNLVSGHRPDTQSIQFEYADYGADKTEVSAIESTLKIVDANGEDFTSCYDVTFTSKELTVTERSINVSLADSEFTYDGSPKSAGGKVSDITQSRLAAGDTISVSSQIYLNGAPVNAPVNAGNYSVTPTAITVMHGDKDVTARYSANFVKSLLAISKRELTVKSESGEKTYDGRPLSCPKYTSENLVSGHRTEIDVSSVREITDVDSVDNVFSLVVYDGAGNEVTENYVQTCIAGTLSVLPFSAKVTTAKDIKTYDGNPLYNFGFVLDKKPDNADITFVADEGSTGVRSSDIGYYDNKFAIKAYLNGENVTKNFSFDYTYGGLKIERCTINITTGGGNKVFDGKELDNPVYDSLTGIVEGHSLSLVKPFSVLNVTGGAGVDNAVEYTVLDGKGKDVGSNYEIKYKYGKLVIEPLQISVTTESASREYDGTALSETGYIIEKLNGEFAGYSCKELPNGDKLTPTYFTKITDAGSKPNACEYDLPLFDGTNSNYEIVGDIVAGTLTVQPKKVAVNISGATSVYGEEIPDNGFTLDCGVLPNSEILTFATHIEKGGVTFTPEKWEEYTLLNAGSYYLKLTQGTQKITGGNAKLANYDFTFVDGALNITPRVIFYKTESDEKVYDGTALINTDYETFLASDPTKAGLLNYDELTVLNNPTGVVNVGERPNINYYSLPNGNYEIDQVMSGKNSGTLKVTPRPIVVELSAIDDVTYGDIFAYKDETGNYANSPDLANGEKLKIAVIYKQNGGTVTPKNVGTYSAELDKENCTFYDKKGEKIEGGDKNYTIECAALTNLKIKQFEFIIKSLEFTKVNGTALTYGDTLNYPDNIGNYYGLRSREVYDGSYDIIDLPYGEQIKILDLHYVYVEDGLLTRFPDKLVVGSHYIRANNIAIYDSNGNEIERGGQTDYGDTVNPYFTNYNYLGADFSNLQVVPREVTVTVDNKTVPYGGALPENTFTITQGAMQYGEQLSLTYKYDRGVKDVDDYDILWDKVFIDGTQIDPDNCNYTFTFNKGTLTVEQRDLKVYLYHYDTAEEIHYGDLWSYKTGKGNYARADGLVDGEELEITVEVGEVISGWTGSLSGKIEFDSEAGKYKLGAGSYAVNMVGGKIFVGGTEKINGLNNYSVTFEKGGLSVLKKDLVVTFTNEVNKVEYGDSLAGYKPAYTTNLDGAMPYDETFEIGGFTYLKDGIEAPEKKPADEYDIEGKDVTFIDSEGNPIDLGENNYEITYAGVLTVEKKKVRIRFIDEELKYGREDQIQGLQVQGTGFERVDGETENPLAYGEVLFIGTGYKQGDRLLSYDTVGGHIIWRLPVGEYARYATEFNIKANPDDNKWIDSGLVLKNYEIICDDGTLEIKPYEVTVKPNDNSCTYGDKEEDIENTFEYTDSWTINHGGLPYGEELILSYSYDPSPVKDVGTYKIKGSATGVVDGDLSNYHVSYEDGTLTVNKRAVSIKLEPKNIKYGDPIPEVSDFNLIDENGNKVHNGALEHGETLTVSVIYYNNDKNLTPKNVGKYSVVAVSYKIYKDSVIVDQGTNEELKNYDITCENGELTIDPRPIKVTLKPFGDSEKSVDYGNTFNYPEGSGNYGDPLPDFGYGEKMEVFVKFYEDKGFGELIDLNGELPKNAGLYVMKIDENACKYYEQVDGEWKEIADGYKNYTIEVCDPIENLRINRLTIDVTALSFTGEHALVYGDSTAAESYPSDKHNYASATALPYDEDISITVNFTNSALADFAGRKYLPACDTPYSAVIGQTFTVYDKDGNAIETGEGVTKNYKLGTLTNGLLKVDKRAITVTPKNLADVYYGVLTEDNIDTLYPAAAGNYAALEGGIAAGETLQISVIYCRDGVSDVLPKNVGIYKIALVCDSFIVYDENGVRDELGSGNYVLTAGGEGEFEIIPKPVTVTLTDKNCEYGKPIPATQVTLTDGISGGAYTLPYGDELTFANVYIGRELGGTHYEDSAALSSVGDGTLTASSPKAVDTYDFTPYVWFENGKYADGSYTCNYAITYANAGVLTIDPKPVTIVLNPVEGFTYDGQEHPYATGVGNYKNADEDILVYSEKLEVVVKYLRNGVEVTVPKNAGDYQIVLDSDNCVVTNSDGTPTLGGAGNYMFTAERVEFTISKAVISGKVDDQTCVYGEDTNPATSEIKYSLQAEVDGTKGTFYKEITLINGEKAEIKYEIKSLENDAVINAVEVGEYAIRATVVGDDFADNYAYESGNEFGRGKLEITKLALTVNLTDTEYEYGEITLSHVGNDAVPPYGGQVFTFDVKYVKGSEEYKPGEILNQGDYKAVAVACNLTVDGEVQDTTLVKTLDGGVVIFSTHNYDITCNPADITVTPKDITVYIYLTDGARVVYGDSYADVLKKLTYRTEPDMPYDEEFVMAYSYDSKLQNAGRYENVLDGEVSAVTRKDETAEGGKITVQNGKDNYNVTVEKGELVIEQKSLTVSLTETECFYGEVPAYGDESFFTLSGTTAYGEVFKPAFEFTGATGVTKWNAGVYSVTLNRDESTVTGGNALVENYDIGFDESATYTIKKLPVKVVIGDDDYVYGARTPSLVTTYGIIGEGEIALDNKLVSGEEFEFTYKYTSLKDGVSTNNPVAAGAYLIDAEITMKDGKGLVSNYDLADKGSVVSGALVISPKKITVQLNSGVTAFEYGKDYGASLGKLEIPVGDLEYGQTIVAHIDYYAVEETGGARMLRAFGARSGEVTPKDVGKYRAVLSFDDCTLLGADNKPAEGGISNYVLADDFTVDPVIFNIVPLKVEISVDDASCAYGNALPADNEISHTYDAEIPAGEALTLDFEFEGGTPVNVGKYDITLADYEISGGKKSNYDVKIINSPVLEITPREITVHVDNLAWAYGSAPESYPAEKGNYGEPAPDLAGKDELQIFVEFRTYDEETDTVGGKIDNPTAAGKYLIKYLDYKAYASDGSDISGNYAVTGVDGWLTISSMVVKVETGSKKKVYDGTPLLYDESDYEKEGFNIVEGKLADGHSFAVDQLKGPTDATGSVGVKNETTLKVVDSEGNDVSDNYIISYKRGTYVIDKRPIVLTTESKSKEYDGDALVAEFDESTLSLGEGDEFVSSEFASITDAGNCDASFDYKIMRGDRDVTELNYEVTDVFGTLSISQFTVNITLLYTEAEYGEQPEKLFNLSRTLPNDESVSFSIAYSDIVNGNKVTVPVYDELILDVGSYHMDVVEDSYIVEGGKVGNYYFKYTTNDLTVVKRNIIVVTATASREYDGTEFYDYSYITLWAKDETQEGIIDETKLVAASYAKIKEIGWITNDCVYEEVNNYSITVRPGKLTVTKREITIKTGSLTETYDGNAHSTDAYEITSEIKLLGDHSLKVDVLREVIDATGANGVKNDTTFIVVDGSNNDVTEYYDISYDSDYGKIVVLQREITVKTGSLTETYNGSSHSTEAYDITSDTKLVEGHDLKADFIRKVVDVTGAAGVDNDTTFKVVIKGTNDDSVNNNYIISYDTTNCGKIVINPATLTITLNNGVTDVYGDGKYYSALIKDAAQGLVGDETISIALTYTKDGAPLTSAPKDCGIYAASVNKDGCVITRADGTRGSLNNYDCTATGADFEITQRTITVTLNDGEYVVYGNSGYEHLITDGAVANAVAGDTISLALKFYDKDNNLLTAAPVNAGEYTVELDESACTVNGEALSVNYKLSAECAPVTFTINPATLTFKMKDVTVDYGTTVVYPSGVGNYDGDAEGLIEGERLEVICGYVNSKGETVTEPTLAGEYGIICTGIKIYGASGLITGGENNYDYSGYTEGKLTINGVVVTVTRKDLTKVYDGEILSVSGKFGETVDTSETGEISYSYTDSEGTHNALPAGYTFVRTTDCATENANVQAIENTAEYAIFYNGAAQGKFIVEYDAEVSASLSITIRTVNVVTKGGRWEYDGTAHTAGYEIAADSEYGLVTGHSLEITEQPSVRDVTATPVPNDITFAVNDKENYPVTGNYIIQIDDADMGKLEVYAKAITVTLGDVTAMYGEDIVLKSYSQDDWFATVRFDRFFVSEDEKGEQPVTVVKDSDGYVMLGVGSYFLVVDKSTVKVYAGGSEDDIDNYDISFVSGKLTVSKREITVVTDYHEKEYDGTPLYGGGYKTYLSSAYDNDDKAVKGLIGTDTLTGISGIKSITNVSESGAENKFDFDTENYKNYTVTKTVYQTLKITKREITVKTGDWTATYTGTAHSTAKYEITSATKLVEGHDLTVVTLCEVTNATDEKGVDNVTTFKVVIAGTEDDSVNDNYDITYDTDCGKIIVNPAPLTITLNKDGKVSFEYGEDVKPFIENISNTALVNGEKLGTVDITYSGEPKNVGTYTAHLESVQILASDDSEIENGASNYKITCADVTFDIVKKAITLTLGSIEDKIYDGSDYSYEDSNCTLAADSSFAYGESIISVGIKYNGVTTAPVDAGTYTVSLDINGTVMSDGEWLSTNYEVTCADVELIIKPATITITLSDVDKVYDGEAYDFESATDGFTVEGLFGTDRIKRKVTYSVENPTAVADDYTITFDPTAIEFTSGKAGNYILAESGNTFTANLTIKPREISVQVADRIVEKGKEEYTTEHLTSSCLNAEGAGFVGSDLANAKAEFTKDSGTAVSGGMQYTVSVSFTNTEVMKNYTLTAENNESGTLIVTDRWVEVTPTVESGLEYSGSAISAEVFDITHKHLPDMKEYGFKPEDLSKLTLTFTIVDMTTSDTFTVVKNSEGAAFVGESVKNAGTYSVTVKVSGVDNYYIEYVDTVEFTITKRKITLNIVNDGGDTEFEYAGLSVKPDLTAKLQDASGEDFVGGTVPAHEFILRDKDGNEATDYKAGEYTVGVKFETSENYDINYGSTFTVTITKRVLVIKPNAAQTVFDYDGKAHSLKPDENVILYGETVEGSTVTVGSNVLQPTELQKFISITSAKVWENGNDVTGSYEIYYTHTTAIKYCPGCSPIDFMVLMSFNKMTLEYNQVIDVEPFTYTGAPHVYNFDGSKVDNVISDVTGLFAGHKVSFRSTSMTVPANAGSTYNWLNGLIMITDENDKDVTGLYKIICKNGKDEGKPLTVIRLEVTVTLSGNIADTLTGTVTEITPDNVEKPEGADVEIKVYGFNVRDEKSIGVTVFRVINGVNIDMSANYNVKIINGTDIDNAKVMTLTEVNNLSKTPLDVTINANVTAENLNKMDGSMFDSGADGGWWLKEGLYSAEGLNVAEGHKVGVVVINDGGAWRLGVVVYREINGMRADASSLYNCRVTSLSDVSASLMSLGEASSAKRILKADLSAAFDDSGALKAEAVEGGVLKEEYFSCNGLMTDHKVVIRVAEKTGGGYEISVSVYYVKTLSGMSVKIDKSESYTLFAIAPDGTKAQLVPYTE